MAETIRSLIELEDVTALVDQFNSDTGSSRLILLLSPT